MRYLDHIKNLSELDGVYEMLKETIMKHEFEGLSRQHILGYIRDIVENRSKDFFVVRNRHEEIKGIARSFQYKPEDGHIEIGIFIDDELKEEKFDIMIEFLDYLFKDYPLRKVFCEQFQEENDFFAIMDFEVEAILKEYVFYDGKYKDVVFWGMTREVFYEKTQL